MFVEKRKRVLGMDEGFLREVMEMNVPLANECFETRRLMRALVRRFEPIEQDEETVIRWRFMEGSRRVTVTWSDGEVFMYSMNDVLEMTDVEFLEQLTKLPPTDTQPSSFFHYFEGMLRSRVETLKEAESAGSEEADEGPDDDMWGDAESDGGEGFFYSEAMSDEDFGS